VSVVLPGASRDTGCVTTDTLRTPVTPFEHAVLPHLAPAARLARALMRNDADAEDAVQDALLRALRYFRTFDGRNARGWFLQIVRNSCYSARRRQIEVDPFDEECHSDVTGACEQEAPLVRRDGAKAVARALDALSPRSRTLIVLREAHGLSYREIASRIDVPIGTVMSGLARARGAARRALAA
jgi:RNA polymerase sigma-70 factor (ECF subfamily)